MQEVDGLAIDLGGELRVLVDRCFLLAPVVAGLEAVEGAGDEGDGGAIAPAGSGDLVGEEGIGNALVEVGQAGLGNGDLERGDGGHLQRPCWVESASFLASSQVPELKISDSLQAREISRGVRPIMAFTE